MLLDRNAVKYSEEAGGRVIFLSKLAEVRGAAERRSSRQRPSLREQLETEPVGVASDTVSSSVLRILGGGRPSIYGFPRSNSLCVVISASGYSEDVPAKSGSDGLPNRFVSRNAAM